MSLKEQIDNDLKIAMKSGDQERKETLRMLKSAIRYAEIEAGEELSPEELLGVVNKQAKQRRDAIAEYEKAQRDDLAQKEAVELAILEAYLPRQMSEEEIRERAQAVIAEQGVSDMRGMGPVMKQLTTELKGRADGKVINQIVRDLLS